MSRPMRLFPGIFLLVALVGVAPAPTLAEGGESRDDSVPEWRKDGRNELALFVGYTEADRDSGGSLGIDYEYRLGHLFGIGGILEYTGADIREGVVAVSFDWHVWKELKVFVATGVEIDVADGGDEFLVRLGVEYGFDIGGKWEAAPSLNFDVTSDDDAVVIGVGFGRKF